ncbi:J domain-containing protein [Ornithinimicrobium faecis]|uniref:J domain-containing protein n=1 Tax=Ornithinimicrobium faecis TaxID=2934158 RepID=A0ABY4YZF1_9MICO|nr:J domain-containing protein [Ornithinimicrobium sp. HY1793]USQ81977.1 J domain-containing protein [Ornithinimicrobium sp. HY1793]
MSQTHYDLLGVPPDADQAQIRSAFRRAMRRHHPDMADGQGDPEMATKVTAAYEVLSDEARRAEYNLDLRRTGQSAGQSPEQTQPDAHPRKQNDRAKARPAGPVINNSDKPEFRMPGRRYAQSIMVALGLLTVLVALNQLLPAWGVSTPWVVVPVVAGASLAAVKNCGYARPVPKTFAWAAAVVALVATEVGMWILAGGPNVLVRAAHLVCGGWVLAVLLGSAVSANRGVSRDGWTRNLRGMNLFGQEPSSAADSAVHAAVSRLFGDAAVRVMVNTDKAFSHVVTRGDRAVFIRGVMCSSGTVRWDGSTLVQDHHGSATAVTFREFDSFAQLTLARVPGVQVLFLVALFTSDGGPVSVTGRSPAGVLAVDGAVLASGLSDFLGEADHVVDVEKTVAAFERMVA